MSLMASARAQVQDKLGLTAKAAPKQPPAPPVVSSLTKTVPAKATLTDGTAIVEFQFAPELIKIAHQSDTKPMNRSMGVPDKESGDGTADSTKVYAGVPNEVIVNAGEASISFGDLMFDGAKVVKDCAQLLKWTYPIEEPGSTAPEPPMVMPTLYFSWNKFDSGLKFLDSRGRAALILAKVDVSYVRFTAYGEPTRAKVTLSCKVPPSQLARTNPTSGGRPDRTAHLVTAGEDLPALARARYGSPAYWRPLAKANGIDDPLRVRPGDRLFVPGRSELDGVA